MMMMMIVDYLLMIFDVFINDISYFLYDLLYFPTRNWALGGPWVGPGWAVGPSLKKRGLYSIFLRQSGFFEYFLYMFYMICLYKNLYKTM